MGTTFNHLGGGTWEAVLQLIITKMPVFQIPNTRISLVLLVHSYSAVLSF